MAEFGIPYSLVTPAGTLSFNPSPSNTDGLYLSDVQGLDGGEVRSQIANLPQRDGAYVFPSLRGACYPTLTGFFRASTTSSRLSLMDELKSYTETIRSTDGALAWTPSGAASRQLDVRLLSAVQVGNGAGILKTFQLQLVSANPLTVGTTLLGSSGASACTVAANGNTPAYPTITVSGPVTSPLITNVASGKEISLPGYTIADGDSVVIDCYAQTVTLTSTGASIIGKVDLTVSDFFTLTNGVATLVTLAGSATGADTLLLVTYRDTYI